VLRAAPGIFETASAPAYAGVIRPNGSYVTSENPAHRGEVVQVALTGLGQTTAPALTNREGVVGQAVTVPVAVRLNDQPVRIVSATYAAGSIGIYWLAFEIPLDASPGAFRSLAVTADGTPANPSALAAIQ